MNRRAVIGMIRTGALAAALFLAAGAIPIVGGIATLFAPAPVLIYAVGRPRPLVRSIGSILLAGVLIGLLAGWFGGGAYLITLGLATLIMVWMLERRRPFELIVVAAASAMVVAATAAALAATGSPAALLRAMQDELTSGMTRTDQFYKALGLPTVVPTDIQGTIVEMTVKLSAALAALTSAVAVLLNLRLFWRWAGKRQLQYPLFGDLARWSAPEWLIWALIATGGTAMLVPFAPIADIGINCFLCVAAVYLGQGLAIMTFYFQVLAVPSLVRGIIYFVTMVQPVVAAIVCVAGVFDLWIDFRRLKPPSQEAGSFGDFL